METEPRESDASSHSRNRAIRLAVLTSILSKFGTLLLRLISIPIAIRVLGMEEFGVYATVTMVVGMIDMMHVGIGPALTQGIARALAQGDRAREQGVFATAVLLSTGLTLAAALVLTVLVIALPVTTLFGENFAPFADSMRRACGIAIVIVVVELICIVMERARDGYLETRYNNAWGAAGNFLGAISLFIGVKFFPTIEFLLLAINGSVAAAKLANTTHFLLARRYLWPRFDRFRRALVKPLLFDGARFSVTYLMSALIEYNAIAYLIGRLSGPQSVGMYNIMVTVHFSATGIVQMITIPLWPAIVDACSRGDIGWIRQSARRIRLMGPAFGFAATLGMVTLGQWAFPLWVGDEFTLGPAALGAFGAYFTLHLWRHVNQVLLLGLGDVDFAVRVVVAESLLVLTVAWVGLANGVGLFGIYLGIATCLAAVTAWIYPMRFARQIAAADAAASTPSSPTTTEHCPPRSQPAAPAAARP
ncbi:MAG: oligosaccharide flippase family protein [Verrucomicrobiales bacterium]|nr:oligosaccharide flippase family protein [Verrucomicrobiales bacterium]